MATVFQYFHTFQCALVLWSSLMLYFVLARAAQPKLTNVFASPWQSTLSAGSHSSRGSQRFPWQSTLSVAVNAFRGSQRFPQAATHRQCACSSLEDNCCPVHPALDAHYALST
jgi:hypothetical protein